MVANLSSLSETVDRATIDRRLADEIQQRLVQIKEEIQRDGYSLVQVDGKTFRVTGDITVKAVNE